MINLISYAVYSSCLLQFKAMTEFVKHTGKRPIGLGADFGILRNKLVNVTL